MGRVILICGKIGSGKTTYAEKLAKEENAVIITQDELMLELFGAELYTDDRKSYEVYCARVEEYVKRKAGEAAKAGATVICENGFWSRSERNELRKLYAGMDVCCELHYIDTPEEQRLINVQKRNRAVRSGESGFVLTNEEVNHFFETPDKDEITVRVCLKFE